MEKKLTSKFANFCYGCLVGFVCAYIGLFLNGTLPPKTVEVPVETVVERVVEVPVVEETTPEQIRTKMNALIMKHDELHPRKLDYIGVIHLDPIRIIYAFEDEEAAKIRYEVE